jgi:hypothetical protein
MFPTSQQQQQQKAAFGGASWNSGNPLLPKSAFGGTSLFGTLNQPQQRWPPFYFSFFSLNIFQNITIWTTTIYKVYKVQRSSRRREKNFWGYRVRHLSLWLDPTWLIPIRAHIQGRVQISKDLKQRKVGEEAAKGQELIRGAHKVCCILSWCWHPLTPVNQDLIGSITVLQNDILNTRDLKAKVDQSVQDTILAVHIIDGFRNPQQHGAYLRNHSNFPLE